MANLNDLISTTDKLADIILVNPKKNFGISAQNTADPTFVFHLRGEEVVTLQSDVTDHFVENNTAIQDQVALKPEVFTVSGLIGELNNVPSNRALEIAQQATERLSPIGVFVPGLTAAALRAYNKAFQTYTVAEKARKNAVAAWNTITGKGDKPLPGEYPSQNKQQIAYTQFYRWWKARQLFTVQTPWNIFDDMIIMTLRATQSEETRMVTDFEITFKKMNFAKTILVAGSVQSGRAAQQAAGITNNGTVKPPASDSLQSILRDTGVG